jgi:ABC-type uncharacterized transport system substrate-binding protein
MTDPVGFGLAVSEARPGATVTGLLFRLDGLTEKQMELAVDLLPGISKIGVLVNVDNPPMWPSGEKPLVLPPNWE